MDWEDVKHFLEVAEAGSTLAASRRLGVSQTTAARRVAGLERAIGVRLFDRAPAGYALTPDGKALHRRARAVADAICGFEEQATSLARTIGGVVRVTVVETLAVTVLAPVFRDLAIAHPEISIDLDTSSEPRDLATGAADIAIRSSANPLGAGLVGRRIGDDPWSLYCSPSYAEVNGPPGSISEIRKHPLIGGGGKHVWEHYRKWLEINDLEASVTMRYSSPAGLLAAVRAGAGLAILPCIVADHDPELLACIPRQSPPGHGIWLLTHERLRHEPRIKSVLNALAVELKRLSRQDAT